MSWGSKTPNSKVSNGPKIPDVEEQMVLRVPAGMADQIRKMIRAKQFTEEIEFEFLGNLFSVDNYDDDNNDMIMTVMMS